MRKIGPESYREQEKYNRSQGRNQHGRKLQARNAAGMRRSKFRSIVQDGGDRGSTEHHRICTMQARRSKSTVSIYQQVTRMNSTYSTGSPHYEILHSQLWEQGPMINSDLILPHKFASMANGFERTRQARSIKEVGADRCGSREALRRANFESPGPLPA